MKRFHVTTFGCQMNEHDSERMKGMLESLGYSEVPEREEADLILFNTCSIREKADERFVSHLYEARALKRRDPERVIGVGGCWAQSVKDQVFRDYPFVDVAFGPGQVHKLAEFLTSDSLTAQGFFEFEGFTGHLPHKRARDLHAWVQISAGCNMKCSYCIVPSTRGREVSRPFEELVDEVRLLAAEGVREVTLLGQNVNSYGMRLRPQPRKFSELLHAVDAIDGIERIRYTSPHPAHMTEDVIRAHAELQSVCQHIHLPLQAGSSRVLKRMRRTYGRERFLDRVALIREHVPDCALTTDIIVGFPGETEADFLETLEVAEEVGFDGAFTFIYSPRRDTEAAEFVDEFVPHEVQVERMGRLVEVDPATGPRARAAVRRADAGRAGRGAVALRPVPAARAHDAQQGRQLRRSGLPGRDRAGRDPLGHVAVDDRHGIAALPRGLMLPWPAPPLADDVIRLRPWRDDDQPAVVAAFADPDVPALLGLGARRPRHAGAAAAAGRADPVRARRCRRRGPRAALPCIGFVEGRAGVGYWLVPAARGRGVATRAVRLLARWAFDALGVARLELTCGPDNVASQRVAERCGFTREGLMRAHLPFKGGRRDTVLYSLLPDD